VKKKEGYQAIREPGLPDWISEASDKFHGAIEEKELAE
jgi:hypothetical protein